MDNISSTIPQSLRDIIIVQRNHKRSPFHPEKIAIAIKKGFDSVNNPTYSENNNFEVYRHVMDQLAEVSKTTSELSIEDIQDTIEKQLLRLNYHDVYDSFSQYRLRRSESRKVFLSSQHKFLKALENLSTSQREDSKTTLVDFGQTIARQFAKSYLVDSEYISLHDDGFIYLHDLSQMPLATIGSFFLPTKKLIKPSWDIETTLSHLRLILNQCRLEQHGEISIQHFDRSVTSAVVNTFKNHFKQTLEDYQKLSNSTLNKWESLVKQIQQLTSIDLDLSSFEKYGYDRLLEAAYNQSIEKTKQSTYQAIYRGFETNQLANISIGFGLDTSKAGRIVSKQLLKIFNEHPSSKLKLIFHINHDINATFETMNYDLLTESLYLDNVLWVNANKDAITFSNGVRLYPKDDYPALEGRGILTTTSINLARLGIIYGKNQDWDGFYSHLNAIVKQTIAQLSEFYDQLCQRKIDQFPLLIGEKLFVITDRIKVKDKLDKAFKHGTLAIAYVGLKECLLAMDGSSKSDEIFEFINDLINQSGLNIQLIHQTSNEAIQHFNELDLSIYGKIDNITDHVYYPNEFFNIKVINDSSLLIEQFESSEVIGVYIRKDLPN